MKQINTDVNALLKTREVTEKFSAQGAEPYESSPEQFAALVRTDIAKWSKVVKESGATVD